ncbi:MAG: nodulation protein NfeD [Chloroflexi bacterium]|nr:nodulation protein NfeD [Chloroflexota bacterium]
MNFRKLFILVCLILTTLTFFIPARTSADFSKVYILEIKGGIVPATADYINRGISAAEKDNAICLIEIDTPGGLSSAMENICQRIIVSKVPVITYVLPGGWAASAGTYISMAAHISAMGPGSTIGAATPISSTGEELPETAKRKAIEFYTNYLASLAESRNHNIEWARKAVIDSIAATSQEAYDQNIVDLLANDLNDLLAQLNGKTVKLTGNVTATINTQGKQITSVPMNFLDKFLTAISDSDIAYILLGLAILGIIFEFAHPGAIYPGIVGAVALFLSLYALTALSAQWSGILLILLAFALFILELFVISGGLLFAGGLVSLIVGSFFLFSGQSALFQISPWLIALVAIIISLFFIYILFVVVKMGKGKAVTGVEGLMQEIAVVKTDLAPKGLVFVHGENWVAISESGTIEKGEHVKIKRIEGLKLFVAKIT